MSSFSARFWKIVCCAHVQKSTSRTKQRQKCPWDLQSSLELCLRCLERSLPWSLSSPIQRLSLCGTAVSLTSLGMEKVSSSSSSCTYRLYWSMEKPALRSTASDSTRIKEEDFIIYNYKHLRYLHNEKKSLRKEPLGLEDVPQEITLSIDLGCLLEQVVRHGDCFETGSLLEELAP